MKKGKYHFFSCRIEFYPFIFEFLCEKYITILRRDVIVVFHKMGCELCAHFAPYVRVAYERYKDLEVNSLVLANMDVTNEAPPRERIMVLNVLPAVRGFFFF